MLIPRNVCFGGHDSTALTEQASESDVPGSSWGVAEMGRGHTLPSPSLFPQGAAISVARRGHRA